MVSMLFRRNKTEALEQFAGDAPVLWGLNMVRNRHTAAGFVSDLLDSRSSTPNYGAGILESECRHRV